MTHRLTRSVATGAIPALCTVLVALNAAPAQAYTASPDVSVADFATGFPHAGGMGPLGVTFDASGALFAADSGTLYRFDPAGGDAAGAAVNSQPVSGVLSGLAFGKDGALYSARRTNGKLGDVVQLDPATGAVVRTVAGGLICPTGLATDPVSGDLFVSEVGCIDHVVRISDPAGKASTSTYIDGVHVDGMTFAPDGTLYIATEPDSSGDTVSRVEATNSAHPGARTGLASVPEADGIAIAGSQPGEPGPPFLVVNRNDGSITRVELQGSGQRDLMTDGSRGDFVAVGPDGCLYATQTDRIVKVSNAGGSCRTSSPEVAEQNALGFGLLPTSVVVPAPVSITTPLRGKLRCVATPRSVHLKLAKLRGKRIVRARVYVGKKLVRTISGRRLRRTFTVSRLPRETFTLTIRATPAHGGRTVLVRRRFVHRCTRS